jgi:hypothetical protein
MRIGVCIPCHVSHIKYLPKCLESIENQTHHPDVVSISISETDTVPELPNYLFEVKLTISNEHQCEGKNRNIAASMIDTEIVTFFDADDIMHPQRLEIIHHAFEQNIDGFIHDNKMCAASQYRTRSINKIPWEKTSSKIYTECFSTSKDSICGRVRSEHGGSTNGHFTCKRSVWESNPYLLNYGVGVDSEYVYKFHHSGYKLGYCPDKLSYYVRDDFPIDNDLIIYDTFKMYTSKTRPHVYCKYTNSEINNVIDFLLSEKSPERLYPIYIIDQVHEFPESPSDKILYNIEQMTREEMFNRNKHRMSQPDITEIWDYSITNYNILKGYGLNIRHVPFRLSIDKIINYRDLNVDKKLYDVVFTGQVGPYRQKILDELKAKGKNVLILENDYTETRDSKIGSAKLLINIHFNESYKVFESIRCEPWLSSGFPVLSESSLDDDPRAVTVPYDTLVEKACEMLNEMKRESNLLNTKIIFYCDIDIRNPRNYDDYDSGRDIFIMDTALKYTNIGYNVTIYANSLIDRHNNILIKNIKHFNPSDEMCTCILFPPFKQELLSKINNTDNLFLYMDVDNNLEFSDSNIKHVFFNSMYIRNKYKFIPDNKVSIIYNPLSENFPEERNRYKVLCTMPWCNELLILLYDVWQYIGLNSTVTEIHIVLDMQSIPEYYNEYISEISNIPGIIIRGNLSHDELIKEKKTSLLHINLSKSIESDESVKESIEHGCIPILSSMYKKIKAIHILDEIRTEKTVNKLKSLIISFMQTPDIILDEYRTLLRFANDIYSTETLIELIDKYKK